MKHLLVVCLLAGLVTAAPPVPRTAPPIRTNLASGEHIDVASKRGQVVVIQFLYTTCVHCQATARMLSKVQNELKPKGLQILGVAFNEEATGNPSELTKFISANSISFPVGSAPRADVMKHLGISVISGFVVPQIMVIDRKGVVRAQSKPMGSPELQNENSLRELLGGLLDEPR